MMQSPLKESCIFRSPRGLTVLEVLIAFVILMVALSGMAIAISAGGKIRGKSLAVSAANGCAEREMTRLLSQSLNGKIPEDSSYQENLASREFFIERTRQVSDFADPFNPSPNYEYLITVKHTDAVLAKIRVIAGKIEIDTISGHP